MIVQFAIITLLWMGLIYGHNGIESGDGIVSFDSIWQDYDHDENSFLPEPIMKGILYMVSQVVLMGENMALWFYPYGYLIGIGLAIVSIINFQWMLYPFVFIYVLHDERKKTRLQNFASVKENEK